MADAGFRSLLMPWLGGGGADLLMALPAPIRPPLIDQTSDDLLARMLRRLPPSLWDIDPASDTLQRDLYRAFASQMAVWLAQRAIARTMTLILQAQGVDLDRLLEDYGLRRYLQRPDPYARQVGMHLLWTPKGTLYSVAHLADLLFEMPHATLRTGRGQQHVFLAATHPVTTPYSYWGLISAEGLWYAVTVDGGVPTISEAPPPGLNLAPSPHTLTWFTVQDDLGATWYVSIHGETLQITPAPPAGYGTTQPFRTLDGHGQLWSLAVRAADSVLVSVLESSVTPFGTWALRTREGPIVALWIEAEVPTFASTPPAGSTDQTPGGATLDWFLAVDETAAAWYVHIEHDTLVVESTPPSGLGSSGAAQFFDVAGQRWLLSVDRGEQAVVATAIRDVTDDLVVISPAAPFQAFQLIDTSGVPWWVSIAAGVVVTQARMPAGAINVTPPPGGYHWWRLYNKAGTRFYAAPSTAGALALTSIHPGGTGTAAPQSLGDISGVLWHIGVSSGGAVATSDAPPVDYDAMATAICLRDATGARWFWRVHGHVLEWSAVLWPDTVDQSPWGDLGWLQVLNEDGALRYVAPTPLGDPLATVGPPMGAPWGWQDPIRLLDHAGTWWHLTVLRDNRIGLDPDPPDDVPFPADALPLREALEAFTHIQAAGSALTLLVT